MRGSATEIEQANTAFMQLGFDYIEHDAMTFFNVFLVGPVDAQVGVAKLLEARLVMRDDAQVSFPLHLHKLSLAIRREIIRCSDVPGLHDFRVLLWVKNFSTKICGACACGPSALETTQPVCGVSSKSRTCAEVKPLQSLV